MKITEGKRHRLKECPKRERKNKMKYELKTIDGRKSFYGKCYVEKENGTEVLYSYDTKILTRKQDGTMIRHWDKWSFTTGRHVKAFCGLDKAGFLAVPLAK